MSTATLPPAARPLPPIPNGANKSNVWRDSAGKLEQHDIELPVDKKTYKVNGRVWACPDAECNTGEWVIEPATNPKNQYCPRDGYPLTDMPLDDTERDPIPGARQRMLARVNRYVAGKRDAAAANIRAKVERQITEARGGVVKLTKEMVTQQPHKGHLPSLAATAAVEIGVIYAVDLLPAYGDMAIGAALATWGAVIGYWLAMLAQKKWATLIAKDPLIGRALERAHRRGRYLAKAMVGTGALLGSLGAIDVAFGLDMTSGWQASLVAVLTLGTAWLVNRDHWQQLWDARRRLREMEEERTRKAAEAEAARLVAEAEALRKEAELREQLAEVGAYDEDNPLHQGERMRIEWERIARLDTAAAGFPRITRTRILPDQTREITAPDPTTGQRVRIGWEYLGVCDPGALVTNGMTPPILAAKEWIVSVLFDGRYEASNISLVDKPENRQNTFLIMITERARLGEPVIWRAEKAVRVESNGARYGYLGRALTGEDLEEVLYVPGQAFGGMVTGTTGGGKGGYALRHILNLLLARMLPVLFDPKQLVDYADLVGLIPIGFTKRHRRIILNSLHLERERRQKVLAAAPTTNRYGAVVAGESRWNTHDPVTGEIGVYGEPIEHLWDEFHDLAKDEKFLLNLTNQMRFQRAAAIGSTLLSQGGGLEDWGNSVLRELAALVALTNFRGGDMQSRLAGNRNQDYSTADLPVAPGMCLRRAPGSPQIPLRAAYITRDAKAEDTVYTTLWGKGTKREMQIDDPMNWISDETKALWETTGLMDLWRLGREGGLQALLADTQEDEEDQEGGAIAIPMPKTVMQRPAAQTRMQARDVLLAILHESPGIDRAGILAHDAWARAGLPVPNDGTISRAANMLDPTRGGQAPLGEGEIKKLDRGPGSKSWTLTPEGAALGAEMAARLAPGTPAQASAPGGAMPTDVTGQASALADMAAQRAEEMRLLIAAETRAAAGRL